MQCYGLALACAHQEKLFGEQIFFFFFFFFVFFFFFFFCI